jgi:glutaredoxin
LKHTLKTRTVAIWLVGLVVGTPFLPVSAQTVYRVVGPDGKVSFSDKPPGDLGKATTQEARGNATESSSPTLPFNLRQTVGKYPVVLYTADNCAPCASGRTLLTSRGVPFSEKTVNTNEDGEALQRISGANTLPFVSIGGQQIKGFSESEWTQFLNAAGYPKTSALPATYRNPPATPLVVIQKPTAPAEVKETKVAPTVRPSPAPDPSKNPAGIQF